MMEAHIGLGGSACGVAGTARVASRLRQRADLTRGLKQPLDSIRPTADVSLACPSSREALLGPAGAAYIRSGIVVATDGTLKKSGIMGAAMVAKDGRLPRGVLWPAIVDLTGTDWIGTGTGTGRVRKNSSQIVSVQ